MGARKEIMMLRFADLVRATLKGHGRLRRRLMRHFKDQQKNWTGAYVQGYFYQGLEDIGILGAKPTRFRFSQYQVDDILTNADVLDIGSNTGFVAIYCAGFAKAVLGVELNPYLNRVARETAAYLDIENTEFLDVDFAEFKTDETYDVVLSLSNHHTIDKNLDLGFKNHISRISSLLRPGGVVLFESHNVFGPGQGGVGDDGDMEAKVAVMSEFFQIKRYRMVRCFLKHGDIDKMFIVATKTDNPQPVEFDLGSARMNYEWTEVKLLS